MRVDDPQDILRERLVFYPVIVLSSIFCVTIFIVIAATFGDPNVPVNQWVNKHANSILIGETVLLTISAFTAMTLDRLRTLRRLADETQVEATREPDLVTEEQGDVG